MSGRPVEWHKDGSRTVPMERIMKAIDTPTGAADERERLIAKLRTIENWTDHRTNVCYDASEMLRADAETIRQLKEWLFQMQNAAIDLTKQLAAQSAELDRVRKGRKQVGYLITWNNPMYRGPQTISFDPCDDDDGTCVPVYTLATPSAAGGEKEG